jgi:hypothetical protein
VSIAALSVASVAAPPSDPPPVATYWVDAATQSGVGVGNPGQIMDMISGGDAVTRTLYLHLGSRDRPTGAPQAEHLPPAALSMGASLPLLTPRRTAPAGESSGSLPHNWQQPKDRMLIYWGCGEHVGANQPTIIDFSEMAPGKVPAGFAALAQMPQSATGPHASGSASFGEWPNERGGKAVPASGSLIGEHKVQGNYSPPIAFTLAQDFMPALGLAEGNALPSGATPLTWRQAPEATGYALSLAGAAENGDVIMWSSAKKPTMMGSPDYLSPAEVASQIQAEAVLPPSASECLLPAEVAKAAPHSMVMMTGYGPEANFVEGPTAPKWVTKVRFRTSASLMRGIADLGADRSEEQAARSQSGQQPAKRKKRFGLGDLVGGALPFP